MFVLIYKLIDPYLLSFYDPLQSFECLLSWDTHMVDCFCNHHMVTDNIMLHIVECLASLVVLLRRV